MNTKSSNIMAERSGEQIICARHEASGLTLLEMLVSMGLLTMIVLGLTAMFLQTHRAFKTGIKQVDVFEGGRAVVDLVSRDFEQIGDAQAESPAWPIISTWVGWPNTARTLVLREGMAERTNRLCDVFGMARVNNKWYAAGYTVSNSLGPDLPVGTLYRYCETTNAPLRQPWLFEEFSNSIPALSSRNYHRVADGIVHFAMRAYDKEGYEVTNQSLTVDFPCAYTNYLGESNFTRLPAYFELELGILEPQTLEQVRSIPNSTAQYNYLTGQLSKIHIFRQQIPISVSPQ